MTDTRQTRKIVQFINICKIYSNAKLVHVNIYTQNILNTYSSYLQNILQVHKTIIRFFSMSGVCASRVRIQGLQTLSTYSNQKQTPIPSCEFDPRIRHLKVSSPFITLHVSVLLSLPRLAEQNSPNLGRAVTEHSRVRVSVRDYNDVSF